MEPEEVETSARSNDKGWGGHSSLLQCEEGYLKYCQGMGPDKLGDTVVVEVGKERTQGEQVHDTPSAPEPLGGEVSILLPLVVVEEFDRYFYRVGPLPPQAATGSLLGDGHASHSSTMD